MTESVRTVPDHHLASFTLTRMIVSTANRMVYPFLPVFARGLGVSLEAVSLAVSARAALGLSGPVLGSAADTRGRRRAMVEGLVLFASGMLLVGAFPTYLFFFIGLLVSGAGAIIVDAAIYAYVGDHVPYEDRGRAIAIVEVGWSAAFLVGIPIVGWLISRAGWSAPFPWLGLLGLVMAVWLRRILLRDLPAADGQRLLKSNMRLILNQSTAVAGLLVTLLLLTANQCVNIVYGVWMEEAYGLRVEQLGAASTVLGLAGIGGVALAAILSDRLGKRRAIGLGIGANTVACLALPALQSSLAAVLVGLFFFYLSFEFALVSAIPLMTELVPAARATLMAANVAAISAGDAIGAFIGPYLFKTGLYTNFLVAAVLNLTALVLLILYVRVKQPAPVSP